MLAVRKLVWRHGELKRQPQGRGAAGGVLGVTPGVAARLNFWLG